MRTQSGETRRPREELKAGKRGERVLVYRNEQMYSQMPLATSMVKPELPGTSK